MRRYLIAPLFTFLIISFAITGCISGEQKNSEMSDAESEILDYHNTVTELNNNITEKENMILQLLKEKSNLSKEISELRKNHSLVSDLDVVYDDEITQSVYYNYTSLQVQFAFDLDRTIYNPLRGFYTNYEWGNPINDFPSSLEFSYIPLSSLMSGPSTFTFDSGLEPLLEQSEARNHQLVLRPYIDYPGKDSGLPSYLEGKVSMTHYDEHGGGKSPDYNNTELQLSILNFIEAFGKNYDGDSRIAVIQLGLLGFWGEWHTWPYEHLSPTNTFQSDVINAYSNSFNSTMLQLRYPILDSPSLEIGFHDDSFAHSTIGSPEWFFLNRLNASGAQERWRNVSIGGELRPELQWSIFEDEYQLSENHQDFFNCIEQTHTSMLLNFGLFNGGLNSTSESNRARKASLSMGYALHVSSASLNGSELSISIENRGVAPFYPELFLFVNDIHGERVNLKVPKITPDQGSLVLKIETSSLSFPTIESPWFLSLHSEYILNSQEILFATSPGNGSIRVS